MTGKFDIRNSSVRKLGLSIALNSLFFFAILFYLKPLLSSIDDADIMYSYSGAFGTHPTELVDFSWGWHFLFGFLIKYLFINFPVLNWYTYFLLFIHFLSCTVIFNYLLKTFRVPAAVFLYAFFLAFFEIPLLLYFSLGNTSIVCAVAGNVWLVGILLRKIFKWKSLIFPVFILFISALLRFHTWAFVEVIFLLFVFFLSKRKVVFYIACKFLLLLLILGMYWLHRQHYETRIPGWRHQEEVSRVLIDFYNSPHREKNTRAAFNDPVQEEFFKNGFFYDSLFISVQQLRTIVNQIKTVRNFTSPRDRLILYWTFINYRIYVFCFFIFGLYLWVKRDFDVLRKIAFFLVFSLLLYFYLLCFRKVTDSIVLGFLLVNWVIAILFYGEKERRPAVRLVNLVFAPVFGFCFFWMSILARKVNAANVRKYNGWICYFNDLKRNPSVIHIASDNNFPLDCFSIIDNPRKFEIDNYVYITYLHSITVTYYEKKRQLGLKNIMDDIVQRTDIAIVGKTLNTLPQYYSKRDARPVMLVPDTVHYHCANVYRVIAK